MLVPSASSEMAMSASLMRLEVEVLSGREAMLLLRARAVGASLTSVTARL